MNKTKWLTVGAVGIVIALLLMVGKGGIGGTTNFDAISLSEGLTVTGATTVASTFGVTGTSTLGILISSMFTQGGGVTATTTLATATTLLAANFDTENVIDVTPGGASLTLTLPASSTLPLGTTAGQSRTIYIRNATTTADINITVAGGTGTALRNATSTGAIIRGVTGGNSYGKIDFVRKSTSDIDALLTVF